MTSSLFRSRPRQKSKTQEVLNADILHQPLKFVALHGAQCGISSVIFAEQRNAIIFASQDGVIRVYDINTDGKPNTVFENQYGSVRGLVQLQEDLVLSISHKDKFLLLWNLFDAQEVGRWKHIRSLTALAKLDNSRILVGDVKGDLLVLSHASCKSLKINKKLRKEHSCAIHYISVVHNGFISCSYDGKVVVWGKKTFEPWVNSHFSSTLNVLSAAISEKHIAVSISNSKLHVFDNSVHRNTSQLLNLPHCAHHIQFLDDDTIALACSDGFFGFISLPQSSFISCCKLRDANLSSFLILPNAQIAAGAEDGFSCIFTPPKSVLNEVQRCATRLYPYYQTAAQLVHPVRAAWNDVQAGALSLNEACATVITPENCKRSLDEWSIAHNLLMQAIDSGDIPASRHFNGVKFHWHKVLYHHCSKLAIGNKDIDYLLSLFSEAEDARVIATGGAEVLIEIISVRKDILQDTRLITNAIYILLLRQANLDIRLQQVLHYQKVQQVTSLINAIVGCIPIAGSIATNVLSGGASILNDYQICGFIESLMGAGNNFAEFGYDRLVDRFVRRSTQILSPEELQKLSSEQRKVIEDAALNLGLTVEQLKERLEQFTKMTEPNPTTAGVYALAEKLECVETKAEGDTISLQLLESAPTSGFPNKQESGSGGSANLEQDDLASELRSLEHAGINRTVIQAMDSEEIASALSAFLVMYAASNAKRFSDLREALAKKFVAKSIRGITFLQRDDRVQNSLIKACRNAIFNLVDDDDCRLLLVLVKDFLGRLA